MKEANRSSTAFPLRRQNSIFREEDSIRYSPPIKTMRPVSRIASPPMLLNFYNITGPHEFISFPASPREQRTIKKQFSKTREDQSPAKDNSFENKLNNLRQGQNLKWDMTSRPASISTSRCMERKLSEKSISSQILDSEPRSRGISFTNQVPRKIHESEQYAKFVNSSTQDISQSDRPKNKTLNYLGNKSESIIAYLENMNFVERVRLDHGQSRLTKRRNRSPTPSNSFRPSASESVGDIKEFRNMSTRRSRSTVRIRTIKQEPENANEKDEKKLTIGQLASKYLKINKAKFPIKPIPFSDLLFTKYIKCSPCNVRQLVTMKVPIRHK